MKGPILDRVTFLDSPDRRFSENQLIIHLHRTSALLPSEPICDVSTLIEFGFLFFFVLLWFTTFPRGVPELSLSVILFDVPEAMIVYVSCHRGSRNETFPIWKTTLPTFEILCESVPFDVSCNEVVPYLNFIIDTYDNPLSRRYIFTHGHEMAWHFSRPLFDQLQLLRHTLYWSKQTCGAVFANLCHDWRFSTRSWGIPLYKFIYANTSMPKDPPVNGAAFPCCGAFWLESDLIRMRTKNEYILIRDRFMEWSCRMSNRNHKALRPELGEITNWPSLNSDHSNPAWYCGRVGEFTWTLLLCNRIAIEDAPTFPKDKKRMGIIH
jgi:hypothetical protein